MSQTVVTAKNALSSAGAGPDRHPKGLYILFASEMWERFGFYTTLAVMTLYLQRDGFGWSKTQATNLWSNYLLFVYATPLIGGWLADTAKRVRVLLRVWPKNTQSGNRRTACDQNAGSCIDVLVVLVAR